MGAIEYKNFLIIIKDNDYRDEKTGKILYKRYRLKIIEKDGNLPYEWFKSYDGERYTIDDIVYEAKFHIDEYLRDRDKFEITLTLRTPVEHPKKFMRFLFKDIEDVVNSYSVVTLERIEAFDKDKALVDGVLYKNEEN